MLWNPLQSMKVLRNGLIVFVFRLGGWNLWPLIERLDVAEEGRLYSPPPQDDYTFTVLRGL